MESTESLEFKKLWLLLKRRWLPAAGVFSCAVGLTVVVTLLQKPTYKAQGKLLLKRINQTSAITGIGSQIGQLDGLNLTSNPLSTQIEVIRSIPLLQRTIDAFGLKDDWGKPLKPKKFEKRLNLKSLGQTDVVQLSYTAHNPQEAAAVVNKLMSLYVENDVLTNRADAVEARKFIANELPQTEATVRQAEAALRRFKEQNHVVALDEEAKAGVEEINDLEGKITQLQAELADATARSANLQNKVGMSSAPAIATNSLNQSAGVQKVLEEYQQVEDQLAVGRTRFREEHPTILNLKTKEAALKALLQGRVEQALGSGGQVPTKNLQIGESKQKLSEDLVKSEVERLGLVKRLATLSNAEATYKQRVNILPKLEQDQRELQRQLEAAQSTYEILLKKLQEVRVAENQNIANARVIEQAPVPERQSLLKPAIILGVGGLLSILLAGATVVILEVRDTSIKTLKEARELFGYTLLGAIPSLKKKATSGSRDKESTVPELPVKDTPRLPIAEAYRMLQANLKFVSSDKALQVIVVTSSVPKEGKSTVCANLAVAVAQLGRRVLLVDADLRHPLQHHIWKLTNAAGLSDVIVGQAEFKAVACEVMANLDVLTAGVIPPNSMALLDSKRMAGLVANFAAMYDFVIIDTPPLIVAADAATLGKMADGVLLVARPGVLDSTSAAAAKESLEHSGQNVLGLVVNGVIVENESDSYFHYTHDYYAEENSTTHKKATSKT